MGGVLNWLCEPFWFGSVPYGFKESMLVIDIDEGFMPM